VGSAGYILANDAANVAAALATTVPIQIITPVTPTHLDIYDGDDYQSSSGTGRTLSFTYQAGEPWPDTITTATFTCKPTAQTLADYPSAASLTDISCTVDVATGSGRKVTVNLTAAQTDTLQSSPTGVNGYRWWLRANAPDTATLRSGTMTVRPNA
jgi:hypothetical protein